MVFCGDCGDSDELRRFANGCNTLVICCTHFSEDAYEGIITGTPQVTRIANDTGANRIVLTHASPRFSRLEDRQLAISEISTTYSGLILFPDELSSIELT